MKKIINNLFLGIGLLGSFVSCASPTTSTKNMDIPITEQTPPPAGLEVVTLGAGCFWCVEAVFQDLKGVVKVESGYANGLVKNPTYRDVCTGATGHAEVCQITYDPKILPFDQLLEVFWATHDPTTLNSQGADHGTQYRSGIYYHTSAQKAVADAWLKKLNDEKVFPNPIVTEILPIKNFYKAEDYHQNYFKDNGEEGYCRVVIKPKMDKFRKAFKDKLVN